MISDLNCVCCSGVCSASVLWPQDRTSAGSVPWLQGPCHWNNDTSTCSGGRRTEVAPCMAPQTPPSSFYQVNSQPDISGEQSPSGESEWQLYRLLRLKLRLKEVYIQLSHKLLLHGSNGNIWGVIYSILTNILRGAYTFKFVGLSIGLDSNTKDIKVSPLHLLIGIICSRVRSKRQSSFPTSLHMHTEDT